MATVILAEKPDQAEKFAFALADKKIPKSGGKFEFQSEVFGDTIVTWGIGHLVGLSMPEKYEWLPNKEKWDLANLPFLPKMDELKYEVSKGKSQQFAVVKACLENADQIIIATDPDREGENIAYNIFKLCKQSIFKKPMKRLWINSLVKSEIIKGFKNLRNAEETISFFEEANARQIADYLVGMNYTELYTLKLQQKGLSGVVSLGRVQTPVNTLVVENDLSIKNFKSEKYKVIECHTVDREPKVIFKNSREYFNLDEFEADTKKYGLDSASIGIVKSVEKTLKQVEPQKLFSLGGIQEYANSRWKYPSKKTDKIIQSLYDRGYLSYPRTDSELITTSEFEYLKANLNAYKELLNINVETPCLEPNKRFVDNAKVLEHYALIPTTELPDISSFSTEERNIYEAVAKRACMMFAEPYKYENTKVVLDVNGLDFQTTGNVPISLGWKKVDKPVDDNDNDDSKLPPFVEGEEVNISVKFIDKFTKEPKRLTEGKLVGKTGIMAKLGLGTPATRSSIVDTLQSRGYIKVENTKVYPTPKGYLLWDLTKNKDLLIGKPETTAQWEDFLGKIAKKSYTREDFLRNIYKYINVTVQELKETDFQSKFLNQSITQDFYEFGDYLVEEKEKIFVVRKKETEEANGSSFIIYKNNSGKTLTIDIIKELLEKGKTSKKITGFKSKENKKYDAYLIFDKDKKSISKSF
ncbi:type IA DNA topoisomerase [Enterococcus cecorum]|uniref:type IA DNA topoisomerase n=1 Tax=Enterococcus cecorum TaxID=44008 RepID=UPI0006412B34|nr:type IA DNA topoisomerase [Enterococcus cecorum]KLN95168.1 DNA topoisomerase [Enterococcus cecorum]